MVQKGCFHKQGRRESEIVCVCEVFAGVCASASPPGRGFIRERGRERKETE